MVSRVPPGAFGIIKRYPRGRGELQPIFPNQFYLIAVMTLFLGFTGLCEDDCNDNDANTFPGAAENESSTTCMTDNDGDGYGAISSDINIASGSDCDDNDTSLNAEDADQDGYSSCDDDCDDNESNIYPGAAEYDSLTDCMRDVDGDGFGDSNVFGSLVAGTDCNDNDDTFYVGAAISEPTV